MGTSKSQLVDKTGTLNLKSKSIRDNDIPGIIEACQGVGNRIRKINLYSNKIGAEGVKHLSAANFPNLTELYLGYNNIGPEGVKHLSAANFPNLTGLWLNCNKIRTEGAKYLLAANFPNLKNLYLQYNNISQPNQTYFRLLFEEKNIKDVYL